jgi:hypothetical protein
VLASVLMELDEPGVRLELDGPITPLVLRPVMPGADAYSLLMPVRIAI